MQDNQKNRNFSPNLEGHSENLEVGRDLYYRDQQRNQQHSPQNREQDRHWDAGNNFHTGYSHQSRSHFPEDTHNRTSNADRGSSLAKHYGQSGYNSYRNPNSLNYGDGRGNSPRSDYQYRFSNSGNEHFTPYGDSRGNYSARQDSYGHGHDHVHSDDRISEQRRRDDSNENYYHGGYMDSRGVRKELPRPDDNPYNEYPGTRSRYKDDDYRYGSGNHTWYQEHRYTDNEGHRMDRDKGDILDDMGEGLREAWHDVTHGVRNIFNRHSDHNRDHRNQDTNRNHNHEYRSREDRGHERGPRWSDESDSGDDSFFYNRDNKPRYY